MTRRFMTAPSPSPTPATPPTAPRSHRRAALVATARSLAAVETLACNRCGHLVIVLVVLVVLVVAYDSNSGHQPLLPSRTDVRHVLRLGATLVRRQRGDSGRLRCSLQPLHDGSLQQVSIEWPLHSCPMDHMVLPECNCVSAHFRVAGPPNGQLLRRGGWAGCTDGCRSVRPEVGTAAAADTPAEPRRRRMVSATAFLALPFAAFPRCC